MAPKVITERTTATFRQWRIFGYRPQVVSNFRLQFLSIWCTLFEWHCTYIIFYYCYIQQIYNKRNIIFHFSFKTTSNKETKMLQAITAIRFQLYSLWFYNFQPWWDEWPISLFVQNANNRRFRLVKVSISCVTNAWIAMDLFTSLFDDLHFNSHSHSLTDYFSEFERHEAIVSNR